MRSSTKPLCMLFGDDEYCKLIHPILSKDCSLLIPKEKSNILNLFQSNLICCIIVYIRNNIEYIKKCFGKIKNSFPDISAIAILHEKEEMEVARLCGELGFNKVTTYNNIHSLNEDIQLLIEKESIKVKLKDFSIDVKKYPRIVRKALMIIEQNYIQLMGVNEIALSLNVSESYLPKEFNIQKLSSPKKLLMYFKIKHSLLLNEK